MLLVIVSQAGCAVWQEDQVEKEQDALSPPPVSVSRSLELIAMNFVSALRQLDEAMPTKSTVHLSNEQLNDAFTQAMHRALIQAGYGIRWVEDGSREHFLQYRRRSEASERLRRREVYEIAVGQIEMRRTYTTDIHDRVTPESPLYMRGVDATGIVMDDEIFNQQPALDKAQIAESEQIPSSEPATIPEPFPVPAPQAEAQVTENVLSGSGASQAAPIKPPAAENNATDPNSNMLASTDTSPLDPLVAGTSNDGLTLPLIAIPSVENVYDLGESNFEDMLSGYDIVAEQILTFPNDSLRLGTVNKKFIERLVQQYQEDSDVFSVVGCSMGPTEIPGGNAALALGRASRVVEALLFAGVAKDRILDEGCWAGSSGSNPLPRRGVVLTLNRNL